MVRSLRAATTLALALGAATALEAQTIDFLTTNGGFTASTIGTPAGTLPNNPWAWSAGTGWAVAGRTNVARQRLLSPLLIANGGAFSLSATHRYNFEPSLAGCFDGGVVFVSINGGAFSALAPTSGKGYDGVVSGTFSNPLAGQSAFCGNQSAANVISTWSASFAAGTTIQVALDGGWDNSFANANPNWNLRSVTLSGASVVPEPGTYALMVTGLAGLAAFRRRTAKRTA